MLEFKKHLSKSKRHWLFELEEDYSFKSEKVRIQLKEDLEFPDNGKLRLVIKKDGTIEFFARIFGLKVESPVGHFAAVRANDTLTLNFGERANSMTEMVIT